MTCTDEELKREIERSLLSGVLKVPAVPDILVKINDVLADEAKGLNDLVKVIQNDTSLSARMLQIANSPALRAKSEITTVKDAVNRLGVELVKNISICVALRDKFKCSNRDYTDVMNSIRRESLVLSVHAYMFNRNSEKLRWSLKPEVSLLIGLLKNIGSIPIVVFMAEKDCKLSKDRIEVLAREMNTAVGKAVLDKWKLPKTIIDSVFPDRSVFFINSPSSYADLIKMTTTYLAVKGGAPSDLVMNTDLFRELDEIVTTHADEINNLICRLEF